MFRSKKKQRNAAAAATTTTTTTAATASTAPKSVPARSQRGPQRPVSPIHTGSFDFPPKLRGDGSSPSSSVVSSIKGRPSVENFSRPRTSDGVQGSHHRGKSSVSAQAPLLPPIPRITSSGLGSGLSGSAGSSAAASREPSWFAGAFDAASSSPPALPADKQRASPGTSDLAKSVEELPKLKQDSDSSNPPSKKSSRLSLKPSRSFRSLRKQLSFEPVKELAPFQFDRPATRDRPATAGAASTTSTFPAPSTKDGAMDDNGNPIMSASMFPGPTSQQPQHPQHLPQVPATEAATKTLAMSRSFIDSRDRAYGVHSASRPGGPPSASSVSQSPLTFAPGPALGLGSNASFPRPAPQSVASSPSVMKQTSTNHSGSTMISDKHTSQGSMITKGSKKRADSTIGTPYAETSPSFPLPMHVATRPTTSSGTSSSVVAGVSVPTHHTSGQPPTPARKDRRKTMLLNPMNLLSRRRSDEPTAVLSTEEQRAQELALRKQKKVATAGVDVGNKDFDPSIRGNVVHDFSAPRENRRTTMMNTLAAADAEALQNADSTPVLPPVGSPMPDSHAQHATSDESPRKAQRKSDHTPLFLEHLGESSPTGLLGAETRENKNFVQRHSAISNFSQESAVLPPFARRSQILDPSQAAMWNDGSSEKRSSDPSSSSPGRQRDSGFSGVSSLSPTTGRTSLAQHDSHLRESAASPVSPSSDRLGGKSPSLSEISDRGKTAAATSVGLALQPIVEPSREEVAATESPSGPPPVRSPPRPPRSPPQPSRSPPQPSTVVPTIAHERSASNDAPQVVFGNHNRSASEQAPEVTLLPPRSLASPLLSPSVGTPGRASDVSSPVLSQFSGRSINSTPEPMTVDSAVRMRPPSSPPHIVETRASAASGLKIVEKRKSAVGHTPRKSNGPRHAKSNASRFSFQLGGTESSADEEKMLEDKHRRLTLLRSATGTPYGYQDEIDDVDDDDDFDESAMDDLDELELQQAATERQAIFPSEPPNAASGGSIASPNDPAAKDSTDDATGSKAEDAREQAQEGAADTLPEEEGGYYDHPAFRSHSALAGHSRNASLATVATVRTAIGSVRSPISPRPGDVPRCEHGVPLSPITDHTSRSSSKRSQRSASRRKTLAGYTPDRTDASSSEKLPTISPGITDEVEWKSNDFFFQPKSGAWSSTWSSGAASKNSSSERVNVAKSSSVKSARKSMHSMPSMPTARDRQSMASIKTTATSKTAPVKQKSKEDLAKEKKDRRKTELIQIRPGSSGLGIGGGWSDFKFTDGPQLNLFTGDAKPEGNDEEVPPLPNDAQVRASRAEPSLDVKRELSRRTMDSEVLPRQKPERSSGDAITTAPANIAGANVVAPTLAYLDANMPQPNQLQPVVSNASTVTKGNWDDLDPQNRSPVLTQAGTKEQVPHSGTLEETSSGQSATYKGKIGQTLQISDREKNNQNAQYAKAENSEDDEDDLYFVDDRFAAEDLDFDTTRSASVDEERLDDPGFWHSMRMQNGGGGGGVGASYGLPGTQPQQQQPHHTHQRGLNAVTATSLGSDGPYPTFAMPNSGKSRQRDSRLLLEDLPLLQGPVDPKLIPQRNPSEDAKRLGLSNKVPPLPPANNSEAAISQMNARMSAYHGALAEALNKAAEQGRFLRTPSVLTNHSVSAYSREEGDDKTQRSVSIYSHEDRNTVFRDDQSTYSRNEDGVVYLDPDEPVPQRTMSERTNASGYNKSVNYSPDKMSFDFGFGALDNDINAAPSDDYDADDDLIAAANADALEIDDGTYGREFDFFAKARPTSRDAQQVNGGFFGTDGDDGLARQKSLKEPNLTPVTERSEFSTRNSFVALGNAFAAGTGPLSASGFGPASPALARLPTSPIGESEITNFEQLRKLRASAFAGSNGSLPSPGGVGRSPHSPTVVSATNPYGSYFGAHSMSQYAGSSNSDKTGSSPASATVGSHNNTDSPLRATNMQDSPSSIKSGSVGIDLEATPRKAPAPAVQEPPTTARKAPVPSSATTNGTGMNGTSSPTRPHPPSHTHSRNVSDTVTYVQEVDPTGKSPPRWVIERRRTSEQGAVELINRQVVSSGWI